MFAGKTQVKFGIFYVFRGLPRSARAALACHNKDGTPRSGMATKEIQEKSQN
jgi:hypothetical protein